MSRNFDVIVLGLGGTGSAVAAQLAARGKHALGLDQFSPPHNQGSSHGHSRIIRQALMVSPCSGHGFKFCPVIGEIAADLVEQNSTRHPIRLFKLARLRK